MSDDGFATERDLFLRAADLPATERERWLDRETHGDSALKARVLGLLKDDAALRPGFLAGGAPAAPVPGARVESYRLVRELGRGGQGVVFLAEDETLGRPVALKLLTGFAAGDADACARLRREAEAAARLDHPGSAKVYAVGVFDGAPFIAMQFVDGPSAAACVSAARRGDPSRLYPRGAGPRSREEILAIAAFAEGSARALHAAHEAGFLHRDVKPGNLLVAPDGAPVLTDFGLAALRDPDGALTRTGDLLGTPSYFSPERLDGRAPRGGPQSDVFALGATLFELLTLRRAFDGATPDAALRAVLEAEPPTLRSLVPAAPRDLESVLLTALEKDPGRRYATALAFAEDLAAVRRGDPIAARPPGPIGRLLRRARRRPAATALTVLLVVGVPATTGLAGYAYFAAPRVAAQAAADRARKVESLVADGQHAMFFGDAETALAKYTAALELDPGSCEALSGAVTALDGERPRQLQLLADHPVAVAASVLMTRLVGDLAAGRPATVPVFDEARDPSERPWSAVDDVIAATQAVSAFRAGRDPRAAADAVRYVRRAVVSGASVPRAWLFLFAEAAELARDRGAAEEAATALLRRFGSEVDAQVTAAVVRSTFDPTAGAEAILVALRQGPCAPDLAYRAGVRVLSSGRRDQGIAAMRAAAESAPPGGRVRASYAMAIAECGDAAEAEAILRPLLEDPKLDVRAVIGLACALRRTGRAEEAVRIVDDGLRKHPGFWAYLRERGRLYLELGRVEEARRDLEPLRERFRNEPDFQALWKRIEEDDE